MKGLLRAGWVGLFLAVLALGAPSWVQTRPAAPLAPQSRVGLLNLSHVIKNYDKYKRFQEDLKGAVKPFQARDTKWKLEAEELAKELDRPMTTEGRKAEIEKKVEALRKKVEDNKAEANKVLTKMQDDQLKILYQEVQDESARYAKRHGLEIVLHYNDHVKQEEYWSPQNIARKMNAGACMPLYLAPGTDITEAVLAALNAELRKKPS